MFGLFKKKPQPQPQPEKPYEPEKPVRELFEAVKDSAEVFEYDTGGDSSPAIRFEFMGKRFGAFKIYRTMSYSGFVLIDDDYDKEEFSWLRASELDWLCGELGKHISEKEEARQKAKRQEFIDALCPDSST